MSGFEIGYSQVFDISHIFQKTLNWDIANIALSDRRCQNRVRGSSGRARGLEGRGPKVRHLNHSIELTLVVKIMNVIFDFSWRAYLPVVVNRNVPAFSIHVLLLFGEPVVHEFRETMSFIHCGGVYQCNGSVVSICDGIVIVDVVLILVKKNLKCFIWLCQTSISCSIARLYCTFSAAITSFRYHILRHYSLVWKTKVHIYIIWINNPKNVW